MSTYNKRQSIAEESGGGGVPEGERRTSAAAPDVRDLAAFLPYACSQLQASFSVKVTPHFQDASRQPTLSSHATARSRSASHSGASLPVDEVLLLSATLDDGGALVALTAPRSALPCLLLKLLAIAAPHQPSLTRLTLRACRLDARAFHQLCELVRTPYIAELCLDDTPARVGGYHLLLQHPSNLACLSLDRCSLGDDGAAAIAESLRHPRPAASTLRALSLASNGVGDVGARALAAALRSNRGLQHLNLADNRITDAGAVAIFGSLAEFELTKEEVLEGRRRTMDWLRRRQSVFARVLSELQAERMRPPQSTVSLASARPRGRRLPSAGTVSSLSCAELLTARAEAATEQLVGPFAEPYSADHTTRINGKLFCEGNSTLRWLDLAYNELGQASVVSLLGVLSYQAARRPPPPLPARAGLLRVELRGAPLPDSEELCAVARLLEEALQRAAPRTARERRHTAVGIGKGRK